MSQKHLTYNVKHPVVLSLLLLLISQLFHNFKDNKIIHAGQGRQDFRFVIILTDIQNATNYKGNSICRRAVFRLDLKVNQLTKERPQHNLSNTPE